MKELSVFVDESGDFGKVENKSPYYLVTLVFHDQDENINPIISTLENSIIESGFKDNFIHTGPIIRREDEYYTMSIDNRRSLLYKMRSFYLHAPIFHDTVVVNKRQINDIFELNATLAKGIKSIINSHLKYFQSFDKVIVYYDNGQRELNLVLNTIFNLELNNVECKKATQEKYRLLQLADFICTFELLKIKFNEKRLSKSEENFFYKPQELKKTFLKILDKKRL